MKRRIQGKYRVVSTLGEKVEAFVPKPLPPEPPIEWNAKLQMRFDQATLSLGRLDGVAELLPDMPLFLYSFIRKEAVLSSMIEGTQSSIADLLMYELEQEPGVPLEDVAEVSQYVLAMNEGLRLLAGGLPLSLRLIKRVHSILIGKGRGSSKTPGQFRRSQNWIGGTRPGNAMFVPPPPEEVLPCMSSLELFLHDKPEATSPLLKAALAHVQFETIHPFLDGNGRVGRLLITLILCAQNALSQPILYLSLYFKSHRRQYYALLNRVRETGDWEEWLLFFADAVVATSEQAMDTAKKLDQLIKADLKKIDAIGRAAPSLRKIHQAFLSHPLATSAWVGERTGLTPTTVNTALQRLEELGIIQEITSRKRNRMFRYADYVTIINDGTDLPV